MSLALLISMLLSSEGDAHLNSLNPTLDDDQVKGVLTLTTVALLLVNRHGLINRCVDAVDDLIASLQKV